VRSSLLSVCLQRARLCAHEPSHSVTLFSFFLSLSLSLSHASQMAPKWQAWLARYRDRLARDTPSGEAARPAASAEAEASAPTAAAAAAGAAAGAAGAGEHGSLVARRKAVMDGVNPAVVLRNYLAQTAIAQ
jgi:uncharacterized protein YdiU (UPF0061 family)